MAVCECLIVTETKLNFKTISLTKTNELSKKLIYLRARNENIACDQFEHRAIPCLKNE